MRIRVVVGHLLMVMAAVFMSGCLRSMGPDYLRGTIKGDDGVTVLAKSYNIHETDKPNASLEVDSSGVVAPSNYTKLFAIDFGRPRGRVVKKFTFTGVSITGADGGICTAHRVDGLNTDKMTVVFQSGISKDLVLKYRFDIEVMKDGVVQYIAAENFLTHSRYEAYFPDYQPSPGVFPAPTIKSSFNGKTYPVGY